jgi:cellulose synthase/poly-beta-1,6-N-acetylglucosamine synthase-like glycosyltransferase
MQAHVYERRNNREVGKGHALNWLYKQMRAEGAADHYTAVIVFDADSIVDPQFLRVMDARLQAGEKAIQGYYSVRDPERSWGTALRFAALAVLHYLRPMGRNLLHGSAGLKGNGMCFSADIYRIREWPGSITEDIEYHMGLILDGERVAFAPDARLAAEMPGSLNRAYTQNLRWENGRLEMVRRYTLPLIKMAFLKHSYPAFDALMEHFIPPTALLVFSILGTTALGLVIGLLEGSWAGFWFGISLLAAFITYLVVGLQLVQAPKQVWLALLYAPRYILWKIGMLLRIGAGKEPRRWVRTGR